jgi:hypothetical protein
MRKKLLLKNLNRKKREGTHMNPYLNRMLRAAKLEPALYEEVEHDRSAMGQAIGVVLLSSVAAGIGSLSAGISQGFISGILTSLIGWFIWAGLTYLIGTKVLPTPQTQADYGQLLRTIAFSSSPGLIRVLGIIPGLRGLVFLVAGVWMLMAMVIAVRQALDYTSTMRAVGVCIIGWIVQIVIFAVFFAIVG